MTSYDEAVHIGLTEVSSQIYERDRNRRYSGPTGEWYKF